MNPRMNKNLSLNAKELGRRGSEASRLPIIGKTIINHETSNLGSTKKAPEIFDTPEKTCKSRLIPNTNENKNPMKLLELNAKLNFGLDFLDKPSRLEPKENDLLKPRKHNRQNSSNGYLRLLQEGRTSQSSLFAGNNESFKCSDEENTVESVLKRQFDTYSLPMNFLNSSSFLRFFKNISESLGFIHNSQSFGLKLFQNYSSYDRMDISHFKSALSSLADSYFSLKYDMANDTNYKSLELDEKLKLLCEKISDWNREYIRNSAEISTNHPRRLPQRRGSQVVK